MGIQSENLSAIANAIREKEGSTGEIQANEFAERILALGSGSTSSGMNAISLSTSNELYGTVSGSGSITDGMECTVFAKPKTYGKAICKFLGWKENGTFVSENPEYTFKVNGARNLVAQFSQPLPDGYTLLEYIQFAKNTYIIPSSGVVVGLGSKDILEMDITFDEYKQYSKLTYSNYKTSYYYFDRYSETRLRLATITDTNDISYISSPETGRVTITAHDGYIGVNGNETKLDKYFNLAGSFMGAEGSDVSVVGKMYSLYIGNYQTSKYKYYNYVPCINPSGKCGMYDIINDTFCENKGTGTITAGPKVFNKEVICLSNKD